MPSRRSWLVAWAALPLIGIPEAAIADRQPSVRLVLLERHDCAWCRRWLLEVGERSWNLSNLGRIAPLRRVDVAQGLPEDLRWLTNWRFTPTFVLAVGDREVGRFTGYQGDIFFWQQAELLLAQLPQER